VAFVFRTRDTTSEVVANIPVSARIPVTTRAALRQNFGLVAQPGHRVAGLVSTAAKPPVIALDNVAANADPHEAGVIGRAQRTIFAFRAILGRLVLATLGRAASVLRTRVSVITNHVFLTNTDRLIVAVVARRAFITVVTPLANLGHMLTLAVSGAHTLGARI